MAGPTAPPGPRIRLRPCSGPSRPASISCCVMAGRLAVEVPDGVEWETLRERIGSVFGIANFGRAASVAPDLEAVKAGALETLRGRSFESFRVTAKRSHKGFPKTSMEIDREVGGAIKAATGARVDLESPELTVFIEVLADRIFYSV